MYALLRTSRAVGRRRANRRAMLGAWMAVAGLGACHVTTPVERERSRLSIRRDASRFVVASSTDSTVTFRPIEARWLKRGMRGYVVDPLQRDALIARLTIQRIDTGGVTAVIDGGVSPVVPTHVVLVEQPASAWWHDRRFWAGVGGGALAGVFISGATR